MSAPAVCAAPGQPSRRAAACLALALPCVATATDSGPVPVYTLAPHTARQIHVRDGRMLSVVGTSFLGARFMPPEAGTAQKYVHRLPGASDAVNSIVLPVRPMSSLDMELARQHPFDTPFVRVLVYWGCGESVSKGQPRAYAATTDPARLSRRLAPSPAEPHWERRLADLPAQRRQHAVSDAPFAVPGALEGDHALLGPGTRHTFQIEPQRGFLPPVDVRAANVTPEGARVQWVGVPGAAAYFATTFIQHAGSRDVVIWTSSRVSEAGWILSRSHPGDEDLKALLGRGVLLGADATECTMPAAVVRHAQGTLVYQLNAYGSELRTRAPEEHGAGVVDVRLRARSSSTIMFTDLAPAEAPAVSARKL